MLKLGETAIVVLNVGQLVFYKDELYSVGNVGYRSKDGSFVSSESGILMYMLLTEDGKSLGWVPADEITTEQEVLIEDTRTQELMEIGQNMVSWAVDLPERPDNSKIPDVLTLLMAIQYDKEGSYGSSWKGKGEYRGIMANIDRKYDRLDKMTDDELNGKIPTLSDLERQLQDITFNENRIGESKVDAIADLANYVILYMTYVRDNFPRVFNLWVKKNVPSYLAEKIPFLQQQYKKDK
jgi:hypothetical protein